MNDPLTPEGLHESDAQPDLTQHQSAEVIKDLDAAAMAKGATEKGKVTC